MSIQRSIAVLLLGVVGACAEAEPASVPLPGPARDTARSAQTEVEARGERSLPQPPRRAARARLSPLADSLAPGLVFHPQTQTWFMAAARGKRLLIDLGRADVRIDSSSAARSALLEVARLRSPLAVGTRVRIYGPWGADDAVIDEIGVWSERIVAHLAGSPRVDSVARRVEPLLAIARPLEESRSSTVRSCSRAPLDPVLLARASFVRDSLASAIVGADPPRYARLVETMKVASSRVPGCFGVGRVLLIVSVRAGGYDWVRERFVVLDDAGKVHRLTTPVYRQRAHDGVMALDADGDGVDELAVRVLSPGAGSLGILAIRDGGRLTTLASGFGWEAGVH